MNCKFHQLLCSIQSFKECNYHCFFSVDCGAKMFNPLAWSMGIDDEEVDQVSKLLGTKTVINEFVAYIQLSEMCLSPRSTTIALCCFANLGSIGVTLGGLTAICPERAKDVSKVVMSSFIAGNAAALLTACVAGALSTDLTYAEWIQTPGAIV